jgi:hypothetical protein
MKRFYFKNVLFLIMIVGIMSTSCKKDETTDDNNNSTTTSGISIKLKIDNEPEIIYKKGSAMVMSDKLIIGGDNSTSDIQFSLDKGIAKGTYTQGFLISHGKNSKAVFTTATNATSYSLTVTEHNTSTKHIKASFQVDYKDNTTQAACTATGSFDITYK